MKKLDRLIEFNKEFVKNKEYKEYITSKNPNKKLVILSCMDTRLTELLPKALNLKNGDAKIIKNAGASIMHPFGSTTRSIIVAITEFDADEVLVVGHHGCGMSNIDGDTILNKVLSRGITEEVINTLTNSRIDVKKWLQGFDSVEGSIIESVESIKNHPLVPKDVTVHGLIMCPETGKVDVIINGYEKQ